MMWLFSRCSLFSLCKVFFFNSRCFVIVLATNNSYSVDGNIKIYGFAHVVGF